MNITFGPDWLMGFKPNHHPIVTMLTQDERGRDDTQTFVKLPLDGRTLLLHPYEGAVPPSYVDYTSLHSRFEANTRLLQNDRTDSVLHLKSSPLADKKMMHHRYYKRFIEMTDVESVTFENYMELTSMLYADNMERFQFTLPKYPYWFDARTCPVNKFYQDELRYDPQFRVDSIWHVGQLLAIRFYYVLDKQVFWARTLRTFDPAYASWKIGTAATVALVNSMYEDFGASKEIHLGLEMEYKPATFKTCAAWDYEGRLGVNLAVRD